jgi:hypothetical protein
VDTQIRYAQELAQRSQHYIRVQDLQCPRGTCSFLDNQGRLTHQDNNHLGIRGSIFEIERVKPRIESAMSKEARSP